MVISPRPILTVTCHVPVKAAKEEAGLYPDEAKRDVSSSESAD